MRKISFIFFCSMLLTAMSIESFAQSTVSTIMMGKTSEQVEKEVKGHEMQRQMEMLRTNNSTSDFATMAMTLIENKVGESRKSMAKSSSSVSTEPTEKLDSIVEYQSKRYRYTYDTERLLITSISIDEWDSQLNDFVLNTEVTLEYDDENHVVKRLALSNIGKPNQNGSGEAVEYIGKLNRTSMNLSWDNEKKDWYLTNKTTTVRNEEGWITYYARWNIDYKTKELYLSYSEENEYFEGLHTQYGGGIVNTTVKMGDIPTKEVYSLYSENATYHSKTYQMLGTEWVLIYDSYLKEDDPFTLCTKNYAVENDHVRLFNEIQESRCGWGNSYFDNTDRSYYEYKTYDQSGNISYAYSTEYLYYASIKVIETANRYDPQTGQWITDNRRIYVNNTGELIYYDNLNGTLVTNSIIREGTKVDVYQYCGSGNQFAYTLVYSNGQWNKTSGWGYEYKYKKGENDIVATAVLTHSYNFDATTDQYKERYYTYSDDDAQLIQTDDYAGAVPKLVERHVYTYNDEKQYKEIDHYTVDGDTQSLASKEVYEYDPDMLYSQTLGELGVTNLNYDKDYVSHMPHHSPGQGHKLISIKSYDAQGNLLRTLSQNYFSPLTHGDGIVTEQVDAAGAVKMFDVQGLPVSSPRPGQIIVTNHNKKFVVGNHE